jgi:hypothetical protein
MKRSFGKLLPAAVAALVVASFVMAPNADARGGGGGGGGRGGGAAAAGGGGGARAGGGGRQVDNSRADSRTTNVRSGSVNNVNVDRNVNVDVDGGWDRHYHPVAGAAVVGTAVAVGAAAASTNCTTVYSGGTAVQQCE